MEEEIEPTVTENGVTRPLTDEEKDMLGYPQPGQEVVRLALGSYVLEFGVDDDFHSAVYSEHDH